MPGLQEGFGEYFNVNKLFEISVINKIDELIESTSDVWAQDLMALDEKLKQHLSKHIGGSTYTYKQELIKSLKIIHSRLTGQLDKELGPISELERDYIIARLADDVEHCSPGFHNRAQEIVISFTNPQNLMDLLQLVRESLVAVIAREHTDEVHATNSFFTIARNSGLGTRSRNEADVHPGGFTDETIKQALFNGFNERITPFNIAVLILEQIQIVVDKQYFDEKNRTYTSQGYEGIPLYLDNLLKPSAGLELRKNPQSVFVIDETTDLLTSIRTPAVFNAIIAALHVNNIYKSKKIKVIPSNCEEICSYWEIYGVSLESFFTNKHLLKFSETPRGLARKEKLARILLSRLKANKGELNVYTEFLTDKYNSDLLEIGYSLEELRSFGRTIKLKELKVPLELLISAGVKLSELKTCGFALEKLKEHYSLKELNNAGFSLLTLRYHYSVSKLIEFGFSLREFKENGFTPVVLKEHYQLSDLKKSGFCVKELKDAGFSLKELKECGIALTILYRDGFTLEDLKTNYSLSEFKTSNFPLSLIKNLYPLSELIDSGFSFQELKGVGFTLEALKEHYSLSEIKNAGFSILTLRYNYSLSELTKIGFGAESLKSIGINFENLKKHFSALELFKRGFSLNDLKEVGFSLKELKEAGFGLIELRRSGFTLVDLKSHYSLSEIKKSGISALHLRYVYSLSEFIEGGFRLKELKEAGFSLKELKQVGFSLRELKESSFTVEDLKIHYSLSELKSEDFSACELKTHYSLSDLIEGGFSLKKLREAGFCLEELKAEGFRLKELREAGFCFNELKKVGFSLREFKESGFELIDIKLEYPLSEIIQVGFSVRELRCVYTLRSLKDIGFRPIDLKWHYELPDLIEVGFTVDELKAGGIAPQELFNEGVSTKELIVAGYDIKELIPSLSFMSVLVKLLSVDTVFEHSKKLRKLAKNNKDNLAFLRGLSTDLNTREVLYPLIALHLKKEGASLQSLHAAGFLYEELEHIFQKDELKKYYPEINVNRCCLLQ